ncbi:MAG: hypothetical protein JKP98_20060 [Rhodobacteraceae bacterium]|nr:hypothetical protein [Paracoccaceae bacterium]
MADPLSPLTGAKPVPLHVAFGGFHLTLAGFDRPFDLLEALGGPLRAAADAAGPGQPPMINEAAFRVAAEAAFGAALSSWSSVRARCCSRFPTACKCPKISRHCRLT